VLNPPDLLDYDYICSHAIRSITLELRDKSLTYCPQSAAVSFVIVHVALLPQFTTTE